MFHTGQHQVNTGTANPCVNFIAYIFQLIFRGYIQVSTRLILASTSMHKLNGTTFCADLKLTFLRLFWGHIKVTTRLILAIKSICKLKSTPFCADFGVALLSAPGVEGADPDSFSVLFLRLMGLRLVPVGREGSPDFT